MGIKYFNKNSLIKSSGVVLFLLLWEIGPRLNWVDKEFLPPLSLVLMTIWHMVLEGTILVHALISFWRVLLGLSLAVLLSLPLSYLLAFKHPILEETFNPLLRIFSQINPYSLMPVFILFFGIGEIAKMTVIAWVSLWPILFNTISAIKAVDPLLIKTARSMGISDSDLLLKVIVPGILPGYFTGLRIGTGLAFFILIAAEMIGANAGLGWLIHNSAALYQIPRLYAAGLVIVLLGVLINKYLIRLIEGFSIWREDSSELFNTSNKVYSSPNKFKMGKAQIAYLIIFLLTVFIGGTYEVNCINQHGIQSNDHMEHMVHSSN